MRLALAMAGVTANCYVADIAVQTQKAIEEKGGDFSLKDAVRIQQNAEYNQKRRESDMPNFEFRKRVRKRMRGRRISNP